jgi:hypothetical protein
MIGALAARILVILLLLPINRGFAADFLKIGRTASE